MKMRIIAKYKKEGEFRTPDEKIVYNDGELYEFKERCNAIADFMGYDVEYFYKIIHSKEDNEIIDRVNDYWEGQMTDFCNY